MALDGVEVPVPPDWAPAFNDEAGWRVLLDEEFFEWLTSEATDNALRKRAYFCLRELLVSGRCARVKPVRGVGRGWLRTPLGGSGGSHYYLWWAPYGTPAVTEAGLHEREVLVRAVRHHDETGKPLDVGGERHELALEEVVHPSGDTPFTDEQLAIATSAEAPVRLVRGAPGSGKTTALWLAGSFATGTKAVYLTYSRGLARTAEDYFRAFGPQGTAVDVLTFEDLLVELADAHPGSIDFMAPARGAERLNDALAGFRQPLGPWKDHVDELYAELHAHAVGRALPLEFRGVPASDGALLAEADYVRLRGDEIGGAAARIAHAAGRHLLEAGQLVELFPGPVHARRLVLPPEAPPPPRFESVTSLIVDEVQDLTMTEAMLVLSLAVRIGVDLGAMPNLLIGGDEAQTVRPTDFRWAWLADLIAEVLGPRLGRRTEHNLTTNLRSPRLIASIIENSRQHYQRFDKGMRPAGLAYVEADDAAVSRIVYCRAVSDADWTRVREFFATTPSGQLVYPGYRVPDAIAVVEDGAAESEADADIATSEQVKGLDYPLVGVIDAGRIDHELVQLAERADSAPLVALWGRTLADQFRVAVSRATETLVLLDRGEEDFTAAIHALCGSDAAEVLEEIDADGLFELLDEDVDPAELLAAQLDEVRRILDDDPLRAVRRVRTAHRILERSRVADDAIELLASDTLRLHGVTAAVAVRRMAKQLDAASLRSYEAEAGKWLAESGLAALYEIIKRIDLSILDRPTATGTLELLADVDSWFVEVERDLPELEEPVRTTLVRWVRVLPDVDLTTSDQAVDRVLAALDGVVSTFEARHPELLAEREHCYRAQAIRAAEAGRFDRALRLHRAVPHDDPTFEARCLEGLELWDEAAVAHEEAGRFEDALRCAREIPDFALATRFAERVDLGVAARMRWATELMASLDPERLGVGEPITEAEEAALLDHLSEALASARSAVPGPLPAREVTEATPGEPEVVETESVDLGSADPESEEEGTGAVVPDVEPEPVIETTAPGRQPTTTVAALAEELQIHLDECLALCSRLGIRARSGEASVPEFMAERVRRRAEREGIVGSAVAAEGDEEVMDPDLLERLLDVIQPGDEVLTVANAKPNLVVRLDASGALVETKRSADKGGAKLVPAWMFNEAWRMLERDGTLSNADLIQSVKRSSAVLALLARLPDVEIESNKPTVLRLVRLS